MIDNPYKNSELQLEADLADFLDTINKWNLEGIYPDHKHKLFKQATEIYMGKQFDKLNQLKTCLLERL